MRPHTNYGNFTFMEDFFPSVGAHTIILSKNIHQVTKTDYAGQIFMDQTKALEILLGWI